MEVDDLILVSVDDHLNEPRDMFEGRLESRYQELAPRVIQKDDGSEWWEFNGELIAQGGIFAVAGKPEDEWDIEPIGFDDIRRGCWDIHERVRDMSAGGVLASLNFPSFPGFAGRVFGAAKDKDLAAALVRAYNDWHIDEWAGSYPGRIIPCSIPMLWDPEMAAEEVRRVARKGCHALTFTEAPEVLGFPSYHSDHWDPLWKAVCDEDVVVAVHLGSSGKLVDVAPDAPILVAGHLHPMHLSVFAGNLLWSRVLQEFPTIKFALSEGGIGWIPYFLERAAYVLEHQGRVAGIDLGGRTPVEVFRDHIVTCFIDDPVGIRLRDEVGITTICWENDYPHSDSTWPKGPEKLMQSLQGLTDDEIDLITHGNALRHFNFDPFVHRPREKSTVGALRAEATDVVLTTPGSRARRAELDRQRNGPVTVGELMQRVQV